MNYTYKNKNQYKKEFDKKIKNLKKNIKIWNRYTLIGKIFFLGLGILLFLVFIAAIVMKFTHKLIETYHKATENRIKFTKEIFQNIKFIKLNGIENKIESFFAKKRKIELDIYWKICRFDLIGIFANHFTPVAIICILIVSYSMIGNVLKAEVIFPLRTVFNLF